MPWVIIDDQIMLNRARALRRVALRRRVRTVYLSMVNRGLPSELASRIAHLDANARYLELVKVRHDRNNVWEGAGIYNIATRRVEYSYYPWDPQRYLPSCNRL